MNLREMRTLLRMYVGEDFGDMDLLTNDAANMYLNVAAKHVANWADSRDQALFHGTAEVVIPVQVESPSFLAVYFYQQANPDLLTWNIQPGRGGFRRLIRVERLDYDNVTPDSEHVQELHEVMYEDVHPYKDSPQELPQVALFSAGTFLVRPKLNTPDEFGHAITQRKFRLRYVYSIPEMDADDDVPGGADFGHTVNNPALPVEYHSMIVAYAAVQFLVSNNADATQWTALYAELKEELGSTLAKRRSARL